MRAEEFEVLETADKLAMIVAMYVRNAMENFHHQHLSDDQMAELNPIVRRAIYEAVCDVWSEDDGGLARLVFAVDSIPRYWEPREVSP